MKNEDKEIWSTLGDIDYHQPFIDMEGKERKKPGRENEYFMETQHVYEFPDGVEMCEDDSVILVLEEIEFEQLGARAEFYYTLRETFLKFQKMTFPLFSANGKKLTAYCWETGEGYLFKDYQKVEKIKRR